jgi:hypothetical protein
MTVEPMPRGITMSWKPPSNTPKKLSARARRALDRKDEALCRRSHPLPPPGAGAACAGVLGGRFAAGEELTHRATKQLP